MEISLTPQNNRYSNIKNNKNVPLKCKVHFDNNASRACVQCYYTYGIHFKGMKKNQFDGIDAIVVERYKPPIEKFKNSDYLYEWADKESSKIYKTSYSGRTPETKAQRIAMLNEWKDYLEKENREYSSTEKLLILKGITKELKADNDNIPPVLNKGVLADTIYNLKRELKENPKQHIDFKKTYTNNLREYYMKDTQGKEGETKWIIIQSKKHDPENFDTNVEKLKTLSHDSWCTKSNNAEPYLTQGDFHIYIENGNPKLGIRFEDSQIIEIQGEKNNSKIPVKYLNNLNEHLDGITYSLSQTAKDEIDSAKKLKLKLDEIKEDIKPAIESKDYTKIFEHFGIEVEVLNDGSLVLSHFDEPKEITYDDLGIDENNLFKNVTKIKGDAKFCRSTMTDLNGLKEIGGNADFNFSKFKTLGKLEKIGGNADFKWVYALENLGELREIGGDVCMDMNKIQEFNQLKRIGGSLDLKMSGIESLGTLEEIGGDFKWTYGLKDLGKLKRIGGDADFSYAKLDSLGKLEIIEKDANFELSEIGTLNKLKHIGGDANFIAAEIDNYGDLKEIKGYIKTDRGMRMDIIRHMIHNGNIKLLLTLNDKSPQYDKDDHDSYISKMTKNILKKLKREQKFGFGDDND